MAKKGGRTGSKGAAEGPSRTKLPWEFVRFELLKKSIKVTSASLRRPT